MSSARPCSSGYLVALAVFLSVSSASAADWPPISPEEIKMTDIDQQKGAPAVILLHEELADDPNNYHSVYMRIKVLTETGRKYADVEIPYSRRNFTVGGVSGRTVHADGSTVNFDGHIFDKVVVKGKEARGRKVSIQVKSFTLPDVQVGSIIDYRYSLRYDDHSFYAPEWIVQEDLFQKKATFKFVPYDGRLQLAHDRVGQGAAWTTFLPNGAKPQLHESPRATFATKHQASAFVDLQMADVPPIVEEPFMPPPDMMRYRVNFYYMIDPKPEDFWREEGKYWNKEVDKFLGRKAGIEEAVARIVSPNDTPEQKIRKIYAFVAQLENQTYRPKREEQEEHALGIKPNEGADDVLRQHSGRHDDLNRLFVAMVRAVGTPAWMMWVASRNHVFFQSEYMSTSQLAAEIAIVQLAGKDVFLDPGTKFCPYGLLDWRYSGTRGVRQSPGKGTEFADTPVPEYNQAMIQRLARLQLTEDGKVEGTVKVGFYGLEAMERRQEANRTDAEGSKKLLEDEIKRWLPGNSEVTLAGMPNWNDTETHLAAEFNISSPLAVSAGRRWLIAAHVFQVNDKPVFSATKRANPIYFWYPTREIDEVHLTLPSGLEVESLPPSDAVKLEYALFKSSQKQESANSIVVRRDLVMAGVAFPVTVYPELKAFYDKVRAGDDQQVVVKASAHAELK